LRRSLDSLCSLGISPAGSRCAHARNPAQVRIPLPPPPSLDCRENQTRFSRIYSQLVLFAPDTGPNSRMSWPPQSLADGSGGGSWLRR